MYNRDHGPTTVPDGPSPACGSSSKYQPYSPLAAGVGDGRASNSSRDHSRLGF